MKEKMLGLWTVDTLKLDMNRDASVEKLKAVENKFKRVEFFLGYECTPRFRFGIQANF